MAVEWPESPPLTGAALDSWVAGVPAAYAGPSLVLAGTSPRALTRWISRGARHRAFLTWPAPDAPPPARAARLAQQRSRAWMLEPTDPDRSYLWTDRPALRLALTGNTIPTEVAPRLLRCPAVASVVVPAERTAGALRRREWQWPLRIGVLDDELLAALRDRLGGGLLPDRLVEVHDARIDARATGLLVARGHPRAAADALGAQPPTANAVLCVADLPGESWAVTRARLDLLRAVTGAATCGVLDPHDGTATTLADRLLRTLRYLSHGHTFDVSLTSAFGDRTVLVGELDALDRSALPDLARAKARQYQREVRELRADPPSSNRPPPPPPPPAPPKSAGGAPPPAALPAEMALEVLADGGFDQEHREATAMAEHSEAAESALAAIEEDRRLQARLGTVLGDGKMRRDNIVRTGPHLVEVFIGRREAGALTAGRLTTRQLGFLDATTQMVRLTVVLVPMSPYGEPVRAELDVPRVGRSANAALPLDIPTDATSFEARIVLLHRNRVLQTAVLAGKVGSEATFREHVVLWDDWSHLDDRAAFDRSFVMNHDDSGRSMCASFAGGRFTTIASTEEVQGVAERIRGRLVKAAAIRTGKAEDLRSTFAALAVDGRRLHKLLQGYLGELEDPRRLQIVTARASWLLPLEFVYDRPASLQATLCPRWQEGLECGPGCFAGDDDPSVVCPSVFWGMNRVIERYYIDATSELGATFRVGRSPTSKRPRLAVTRAAFAASRKVKATDVKATAKSLGVGVAAKDWQAWAADLAGTKTDLLVLMPHTDPEADTLEVAGALLAGGEIEASYVTGGQDVMPLVVLFGCDTAGFERNPAGYASLFMQANAGACLSTFTMVLAGHAARMSQLLAALLRDEQRDPVPMGELVSQLRRDLVREGILAGLSITAYGDSSWQV